MSKKKKTTTNSKAEFKPASNPEQLNAEVQEQKEREIDKKCSDQIEAILHMNNRGLQPYLIVSEYGMLPRVRLARINKDEKNQNKQA